MNQSKDVVVRELKTIESRDGVITPNAVVAEAEHETSPLHKYFDWDDSEAASNWRLHQARLLINSVKIELVGKDVEGFYNVKVTVGTELQQGYVSAERVMSDKDLHSQVIKEAVKELKYWQVKYNTLSELDGVINTERLESIDLE